MLRVLRFIGNKQPDWQTTPVKNPSNDADTSQDDSSLSMLSSKGSPLSIFQTRSFQQRFHTQHPISPSKENFSSFMERAAKSLPPDSQHIPEKALESVWWNFDRDYSGMDDDFEEVMDFSYHSDTSHPQNDEYPFDGEEDEECKPELFVDGFYGNTCDSTAHLLSQHQIIRSDIQELGSNNLMSYHPGDNNDDIESIASECSSSDGQEFQRQLHDSGDDDFSVLSEEKNEACEEGNDVVEKEFLHNNIRPAFFLEDAPVRTPKGKENVPKCFENVVLLSPEDFDTLKMATEREKRQDAQQNHEDFEGNETTLPFSPSLSDMVHHMSSDLLKQSKEDGLSRSDNSKKSDSESSLGSSTLPSLANKCYGAVYRIDQYTLPIVSNKKGVFESFRKKLASSFRSETTSPRNRVTYSLAKGRSGMTVKDRIYAQSLLPAKPLLTEQEQRESSTSTRIPRSVPFLRERPLSILLLNPILKVFEIVLVDFLRDTTIGDVLCKARANATDSSLSEQKYISLCNRKQELAAPMLPVSLLVESAHSPKKFGAEGDRRDEYDDDWINRRHMEARLLVAVPVGSNASVCQAIRRKLWRNPKVQRWWIQSDPFNRPVDKNVTVPDDGFESQRKKNRKARRDSNVKYQRLEL